MVTHARTGADRRLHGGEAETVIRGGPATLWEGAVPVAQVFARQLHGELLLVEIVQLPDVVALAFLPLTLDPTAVRGMPPRWN